MSDDTLRRDLEHLRETYRGKLPGLLSELEALLSRPGGADETARWERAHQLAHRVMGTSGSHGFSQLSGALRRVEHALEQLLRGDAQPEAVQAEIEHALAAARNGLSEVG